MKPWLKWTVIGVAAALLVAGTVRTLSARGAKQAALQAQQTAQQTQVTIDLRPSDLVSVQQLDLALHVPLSGPVKAVNSAWVKARLAGELQGLSVREGDPVKAGQVLGRIDPTEADARLRQARQQAQASRAQLDIAQRSHDNNLALVAQGFISSTALAASQANLAAAQATYAASLSGADVSAKALSDSVLKAPISGLVAQRLAQPGERLAIDARVIEIVDLSQLELHAELSAADALQVRVGQTAQLRVDGAAQPVPARVVRINPSATEGSRAVPVYLALAPGSGLRQGAFIEGQLATGTRRTLAVPLNAVRTDKPQPYVQVVQNDRVQHLNVTLGTRSDVDNQTLVGISGAPLGASVIRGTVGVLREGTPVRLVAERAEAN